MHFLAIFEHTVKSVEAMEGLPRVSVVRRSEAKVSTASGFRAEKETGDGRERSIQSIQLPAEYT